MFQRIAIVNRGEPAMRLVRAVRELAAETGTAIETVALHTEVERQAMFVRQADLSYDLGAAAARPYLDLKVLHRALVATGSDAAWVGWGFVAEDPAFAELCAEIGVTFIGPSAAAMRTLGDKIGAKQLAERTGVPVAPWSGGAVATLDAAIAAARDIGYPLMLKAAAGGGGRGIRVISNEADLVDAYERTGQEAQRAFGSDVLFLESLVTGARHVEVQVIADGAGTAWALGVRDCSIQRRNQKIIEESSSPLLDAEQAAQLKASAQRLALAVRYRGAATVEFLYQPAQRQFAFLEVNTRLQVEHPITEATTGFDLVKAQLLVASGGRLAGEPPQERGHAIEVRLNAEDPDRDFAPAPGRIERLDVPTGPGIRVDTGVGGGDTIPSDFDSMIAKIIAHGRDRSEALARLRQAVLQTTVIIEGGVTNKSFLLQLLEQSEIIDATADTGYIDRVRSAGGLVTSRHSAVAVAAAAIEIYEHQEAAEQKRLLTTAFGGRPQVQHHSGQPLDLQLRGVRYRVRVGRVGAKRFRVVVQAGDDIATADIDLDRFDRNVGHAVVNGTRYRLLTSTFGRAHLVEVNGVTHRIDSDAGGVVRAPAPALVVAMPQPVGAEVGAGDPIIVLESMKMETVLRAPFAARVRESQVSVGMQVETGAALLALEELAHAEAQAETTASGHQGLITLDLPSAANTLPVAQIAAQGRDDLRSLVLGYDVDPHDEHRVLNDYLGARVELVAEGHRTLVAELELLDIFSDIVEISQDRPSHDVVVGHVYSAREHFHAYLQNLDVERAGLPQSFQDKLLQALRHYGVTDLQRTPALEAAVFRVFLAQRRASANAGLLAALLRAWLREPIPDAAIRENLGIGLQRLVAATQVRFPVVADLARGIVYAWFAQPLLRRNRARVYTDVRKHLQYLDRRPDAPDRAERVAFMVRSTEPLVRILGQRLARGIDDNAVMLEVLTRRYYGNKGLVDMQFRQVAGSSYVIAQRADSRIVSCAARFSELGPALHGLADLVTKVVLDADLYLRWERQPPELDAMAAALQEVVTSVRLPDQVRRLTIAVAGSHGAVMHHHFTFQRDGSQLVEDRLIRGLHPYIAERLQLQRWHTFDLTRLPSSDDEVFLFHAVAQQNSSDQRLVAFSQVRDLTALRDHEGRLLALPTTEGTLAACVESIRRARSHSTAAQRFSTNRIVIFVWPPSELTQADLDTLVTRIMPTTSGAGLEEILFIARQRHYKTGELRKIAFYVRFGITGAAELIMGEPPAEPVAPIDKYRLQVLRAGRRNTVYPYEMTKLLGDFVEYDLGADGALAPVDRPAGGNTAALVVGVVATPTLSHPDGISRVVVLGDPTKSLGALSEPECRRIIAALDLALRLQLPVEWYAVSSGARISMDSGTENMDWVAAVLARIVEFTQNGGEINIVVAGINVGAQPYWNAEATMLMHTRGILVMMPNSAMVLTGKKALDFSGGVSAEDDLGIGGYERIMGRNGQAQYWAPNLSIARDILMSHYDHTYVVPGEAGPRRVTTTDPRNRDICSFPHTAEGCEFETVGEIFSATLNSERKKPFDIRTVMRAVSDQDHPVLERWKGMADAEMVVVQDLRLGGMPVCMLGIQSLPVPRRGFIPTDGPATYTAATLFPQSSKKAARAINAASGNRPLVVLANLSGFDGSPESLRKLQLEYGAEIGRAIVNFRGPIVFCVLSRYHGGAFVVFSKTLNSAMTVLAVEGAFASVIGGAPAAAVVFASEVDARTAADPRVTQLEERAAAASGADRATATAQLDEVRDAVRIEKLAAKAVEFDRVHSIQRAVEVGSVDAIVSASELRPRIIAAIETTTATAQQP